MKVLMTLFLVLNASVILGQTHYRSLQISGMQNSSLEVSGKTNVTGFSCTYEPEYFQAEHTLKFYKKEQVILLKDAELKLDIDGFDCGGKAINKDFRKMLKADDYPHIILNFKQVELTEAGQQATITINIAGQQNTYTIPVTWCKEEQQHLKGILNLNITDFDLELPKKLFGLITIKDAIAIRFDIAGTYAP